MGVFNPPLVIDRDAFRERLAIMIVDWELPATEASSKAADSAYETRFSIVATSAIRGDWEPAKELCRVERERFGDEHAKLLMRSIQDAVAERQRELA